MDGAFRSRRIILAYLTTGFSKVATAAVQILALPIAASSLGVERFGALLLLAAVGSFLCIPAQGFSPSISYGISRALGLGDRKLLSDEFWSGALLSFGLGTIVTIVLLLGLLLIDPRWLNLPTALSPGDLLAGGIALAVYVFLYYAFWWAEGLRAGYQEQYITNFYSTAASIAALLGVILVQQLTPNVAAFYLAIFASPPLLQAFSFLLFYRQRRKELGKPYIQRETLKSAAGRAWGYSGAQIGVIVQLQGAVVLATRASGLEAGAVVGGAVRLFQIIHSFMISMISPVTPAISRAAAAGDTAWQKRATKAAVLITMPALFVIGCLIAWKGEWLLETWLGIEAPEDDLLFVSLGALAFLYMSSQILYLLLLAVGAGGWASQRLLYTGLIGTAGGAALLLIYPLHALVAAQASAMLFLAFLPITRKLRHHLTS